MSMPSVKTNGCELTMVLCAYGDNPFLEDSLKSLARQTVPVRMIVATSTPSAYIETLAAKYGAEYRINPERGGGIAADWEFAADCAETPYVTIAHQDDIYFSEYAARVLLAFEKAPDSQIVFTDYCDLVDGKYLKHRGYLLVKRLLLWPYYLKRSWRLKLFKRLPLCWGNAISCPSVSYNIGRIGKLRFDRDFSVNLDWRKWLELSNLKGAFSYVPRCSMAHRIDRTTETSASIRDNRRRDEDLRIFTEIWGRGIARFLMRFYSKSYKMAESGRAK